MIESASMPLRGTMTALALVATGCAFDASGALFNGAGDGGSGGRADAGPAARDARPGFADARPNRPPDAGPSGGDGTVLSKRGSVDMYDGNFDDWDAPAYSFAIDRGMDYHPIDGYTPSATLTFASQHDDTFIYFALIVADDTVLPAEHPLWRDDSIAIYLDAAGDRAGPFGDDDHEIVIGSNGTYLDYAPGATNAELNGNAFSTADGYALEIGIRKDSLGVGALPATLGIDLGIDDDDDGGDAAFGLWYRDSRPSCPSCCAGFEHPEAWCDTTLFGSLILE